MPNTIDEKISLLTKIILERIEFDFKQKQTRLIDNHKNRIESIISEYEEKKRLTLEQVNKDAQSKKQRIILKTNTDKRLAILKKRKELMEKVTEEIKERVSTFLATEKYKDFLSRAITKVLSRFSPDQFVYLKFSNNDLENNSAMILQAINALRDKSTYLIDREDSLIGGVFVKSEDGRLEADFTINTILEENHKKIGEILFSWLDKEN